MPMVHMGSGVYFRVDGADMPAVMLHTWSLHVTGYVRARINGKFCLLHRFLMPDTKIVDHIDGEKLNNSRSNLRSVTAAQNSQNSRKQKNCLSPYKGVSRINGKWMARLRGEGTYRYLGLFDCEEDAAEAYNEAAVEVFGQFARLNQINSKLSDVAQMRRAA